MASLFRKAVSGPEAFDAAQKGDLATLQKYLDKKGDPNFERVSH